MAFLYYTDDSVVDATGARFFRGAVLVKPDWLISSAIDTNNPLGFPTKTLLARVGAVAIEGNLTLNEDEDEQEREVIKIVRPSKHHVEVWWLTDISLVKTLMPFKLTSAVGFTPVGAKRELNDKYCFVLLYAKRYNNNMTEDKILIQASVELLPAMNVNCGAHFSETTMTCGIDTDETRQILQDDQFCVGNSGGPLVCDGEVTGIQTYIENNCRQPHLYQLLSSWVSLITCATQHDCYNEMCANTCMVTNKDELAETQSREPQYNTVTTVEFITSQETFEETTITSTVESTYETGKSELANTLFTSKTEETLGTNETTQTEERNTTEMSTTKTFSNVVISSEPPTQTVMSTVTAPLTSTTTEAAMSSKKITVKESSLPWPRDRTVESNRKMYESQETRVQVVEERKSDINKQKQNNPTPRTLRVENAANRNTCLISSLLFSYFVLACVM